MAENGESGKENGRRTRVSDEPLALLLASGCTVADAAAKLDIGERTISRRLADPKFKALITDCQAQMAERAMSVISNGLVAAALEMCTLSTNAESEAVRLRASMALHEVFAKNRDNAQLVRIEAMLMEAAKKERDQ
jgi:hypothetical protein